MDQKAIDRSPGSPEGRGNRSKRSNFGTGGVCTRQPDVNATVTKGHATMRLRNRKSISIRLSRGCNRAGIAVFSTPSGCSLCNPSGHVVATIAFFDTSMGGSTPPWMIEATSQAEGSKFKRNRV